jgi:signal peptidase I
MSTTPKHRWRENVEALTMAIVVALLFKYFVLEISKIPSGSMQPTLMGNEETGVFDRTLVDKLSFRFRDPRRFEIVVFKHPLERSRIMVKRLVGMPGEELKLENGDLWTRPGPDDPWSILRRPAEVMEEMWRDLAPQTRVREWSVVRAGKEWLTASDSITARGDGAARFREGAGPIQDHYRDGYPAALIEDVALRDSMWGRNAVGDLRLTGRVAALPGTRAVTFELTEGQRAYTFTLPGPDAADDEVTLSIRDSSLSSERVERGARERLVPGAALEFVAQNLDDRLSLVLDGRTLLDVPIPPSSRQEASLTVAVDGAGADLSRLRVARDVYYLTPGGRASWTVRIPSASYVMLGDNTQDSADSRLWRAKTYAFRAPGGEAREVRGNFREGGENPTFGRDGGRSIRFRDQWGEVHWFPKEEVTTESLPGNDPFVPRGLIVGRAVAVFWPIRPLSGLWRLTWLH